MFEQKSGRNLRGRTRIRLSQCFRADIAWWKSLSYVFNGVATMILYNYGDGPVLFTDASNSGYGLVLGRFMGPLWSRSRE